MTGTRSSAVPALFQRTCLACGDRGQADDENGNWLTAVGGGGRTTDVIHTNATQLQAWEKFTLVPLGPGWYAIQTIDGHYLTAVNSGGVGSAFDAIHSNATQIQAWEEFNIVCD